MSRKRKTKRGMKVGTTKKTIRKIRGKRRQVYVTRVSKKNYRTRLVNPKVRIKKGSSKKQKVARRRRAYNYGRSYKMDKAYPYTNKREIWETGR